MSTFQALLNCQPEYNGIFPVLLTCTSNTNHLLSTGTARHGHDWGTRKKDPKCLNHGHERP